MKTKWVNLVLLVLCIAGCGSLSNKVYKNIKVGDTEEHLNTVMGDPQTFGASQRVEGAKGMYYVKGAEMCAFTVKDGYVVYMACDRDPNYVSTSTRVLGAMGAAMQGVGNGMSRNSQNRMNCTSTNWGGTVRTSCQ